MNRILPTLLLLLTVTAGTGHARTQACWPVPMEEAIRIATEYAQSNWRPEVELLRVDTAHPPREWETATYPPGMDGRRCAWNLELKDPTTHALLITGVYNGSLTGASPNAGTDMAKGIRPQDVRVSGAQLAAAAQKAGLLPATPPGTAGYGFSLRNLGFGRFAVTVTGVDHAGRNTTLAFDPTTGEPLP